MYDCLPTRALKQIQTDVNRELSLRGSKHPVTILKEWVDQNPKIIVAYGFRKVEDGWVGGVYVILENGSSEDFKSFEQSKKKLKRKVALEAIDYYDLYL